MERPIEESDVNRIKNFLVLLLNNKEKEDEIRINSVKIIKDNGTDLIEISINPNLYELGWKKKLDDFIDALLLTKVECKEENNKYILRLEGIDKINPEDNLSVTRLYAPLRPAFHKSFDYGIYKKLTVVFQIYQPNIKLQEVQVVYNQFYNLIFTPYFIFGVDEFGNLSSSLEVDINEGPIGDIVAFMNEIKKKIRDIIRLSEKTGNELNNDKIRVNTYKKRDGTLVNGYFRRRKNKIGWGKGWS